jgi:hypothetical protein
VARAGKQDDFAHSLILSQAMGTMGKDGNYDWR